MNSLWIAGPLIGFVGMMSGGFWGVGCGWIVVPAMLILGFDPLDAGLGIEGKIDGEVRLEPFGREEVQLVNLSHS